MDFILLQFSIIPSFMHLHRLRVLLTGPFWRTHLFDLEKVRKAYPLQQLFFTILLSGILSMSLKQSFVLILVTASTFKPQRYIISILPTLSLKFKPQILLKALISTVLILLWYFYCQNKLTKFHQSWHWYFCAYRYNYIISYIINLRHYLVAKKRLLFP